MIAFLAAAASAADTVAAGAAQHMDVVHQFREFLDTWHEFYLMTGTAAVTLAGLLFVALSLHLEVLIQERFFALLVVAQSTLATFVSVLIISLMLLAPGLAPRPAGVMLAVFAAVFLVVTVRQLGGALRDHHEEFPRHRLRRRLLIPIAGYAAIGLVGWGVLNGAWWSLFMMVSIMCTLLANAVWSSWDLLVRVARAKGKA